MSYPFESLTPNTKYFVKVKGDCGSEGESVYSDVIDFTTLVSCTAPTGLEIAESYPTAHAVSFTWDYQTGEVYQFALPNGNVTDPAQVTWNTTWYAGEDFPAWDNLTAETTRTFWLRKKCSDTDFSEPVYVTFTTPEACPAPTGFAVAENGIGSHTATLEWEGTSNSYQVSYRTAAYYDGVNEDFTGLTSGIPAGWNNDEGTTTDASYKWTYYNDGHEATPCLRFNSYNNGSGNTNFLKTPAMNFSGNVTPVLSFWWKNPAGGDFSVYISTDGGDTKTPLKEGMTGQSTWKQETIDLTNYIGATNVTIHFKGTSNYGYGTAYIFLDEVIFGTPVPAGEMQYETNIEAETVTLPGLLAETQYEAWLIGDCDSEGFSTEVGPITFTTDVACPAPTGFALEQTKSDHVVLNWNAGADAWQIQINDNTVYTDVALADVTINEGVVTYTLNGLTENTPYTLKLRANCGDEGYSKWSNSLSFTTLEACPQPTAVNVTNIEHYSATVNWTGNSDSFTVKYRTAGHREFIDADFENGFLPTGWTIEGDNQTSSKTWRVKKGDDNENTGAHESNYNAAITHNTSGQQTYLVTSTMDLSGKSNLNLALYYVNRDYSGDTDEFGIYYRIDGGEWNEIFATTDNHETWTAYDEPLPAGAYAANCQIGFKFTDEYGHGLGLDDITLGEMIGVGTWIEVPANDSPANITTDPDIKYEVVVIPSCSEESASVPVFFNSRSVNDKIFAVEGEWNEASNWIPEGVPTYDQTAELRANTTIIGEAFAKTINQSTYSITIENGAKLKSQSSVIATVKKTINGWTVAGDPSQPNNGNPDGYYLITPFGRVSLVKRIIAELKRI